MTYLPSLYRLPDLHDTLYRCHSITCRAADVTHSPRHLLYLTPLYGHAHHFLAAPVRQQTLYRAGAATTSPCYDILPTAILYL